MLQALLLGTVAVTPYTGPNMNGDYIIANPLPGAAIFSTASKDYEGGVEYFEVYSPPITTHYSQVTIGSTQKNNITIVYPPSRTQTGGGRCGGP